MEGALLRARHQRGHRRHVEHLGLPQGPDRESRPVSSKYLSSIQAGTEVFLGTGRLDTDSTTARSSRVTLPEAWKSPPRFAYAATMRILLCTLCISMLAALPALAADKPGSNQRGALASVHAVPYTWKSVHRRRWLRGRLRVSSHGQGCVVRAHGHGRRLPQKSQDPALGTDARVDSIEDLNLMGVESIAVDPSDANKVYLACGTYTAPEVPDGAILRSSDQGRTFKRSNVPIKFGGNEAGRGNGERMAVDPNDGRILFLGTRKSGLWKSADGAVTWTKVESFPADVLQALRRRSQATRLERRRPQQHRLRRIRSNERRQGQAQPDDVRGRVGDGQSPASIAATMAAAPGKSCRAADQVPPQPRGAGLGRKSVRHLRNGSWPHANGGWRGLEAGHARAAP